MARLRDKKNVGARKARRAPGSPRLDPLRTGMPALDSITAVEEFGKGKKAFRIFHTKEVDRYEQVPVKAKQKKR